MSARGPLLSFAALQRDVRNVGMSGPNADIAETTRIDPKRPFALSLYGLKTRRFEILCTGIRASIGT
jgi:hypothetical protein